MGEGELDATVVVPTYNGKEVLRKTLKGILSQDYSQSNYEVIVADDGSMDRTDQLFDAEDSEFGAARSSGVLKYIRLPENKGRAAARNAGIKAARGEIIIFLDNDTIPQRDLIEKHVSLHKKEEGIMIVGNVRFPKHLLKSKFVKFCANRSLGAGKRKVNYNDLPFWCASVTNSSVRREDLEQVNGFDETFKVWGGEEEDLWYRLKNERGLRSVFLKEAVAWHIGKWDFGRFCERYRIYSEISVVLLKEKHPDYFNGDIFVRNLEPIEFRHDKLKDIMKKVLIILITAPPLIYLVEWLTKRFEFSKLSIPLLSYGAVLCRYYRLGVRERDL